MSASDTPPIEKLRGRKLGKILWRLGKVSEEQLKQALVYQQRNPGAGPIGGILVELGFCSAADVRAALAAQNGTEMVSSMHIRAIGAGALAGAGAGAEHAGHPGHPGAPGAHGSSDINPTLFSAEIPASVAEAPPGSAAGGEGLEKLKGRRLGKILWRLGRVTEEQLKQALVAQQRGNKGLLGEILVEMGLCTADEVRAALAAQVGEPFTMPTASRASGSGSGSGSGPAAMPKAKKPAAPAKPGRTDQGSRSDGLTASSLAGMPAVGDVPAGKGVSGEGVSGEGVSGEGAAGGDLSMPNLDIDFGDLLGGSPGAGDAGAGEAGDPEATRPMGAKPGKSRTGRSGTTPTMPGADAGGDAAVNPKLKGRKLGKILWRMNKITEDQLKDALIRQLSSQSGGPLGSVLVGLGYCSAQDIREALAAQRGVPVSQIEEDAVDVSAGGGGAGGGDDEGGGGAAPAGPVNIAKLKGRKLGKILWRMGKVSLDQIKEALLQQKQKRRPLGEILVEMGHCVDRDVEVALAAQMGIETVDLSKADIPPEVIGKINAQTANLYRVIPLEYQDEGKVLTVAVDNPDNFQATDDLRTLFGFNVRSVLTEPDTMDALLTRYYGGGAGDELKNIIDEISADEELAKFQGRGESIDLTEINSLVEAAPVKKLLNLVLLQAIKDKASDIHFEPFENEFKMRYRVDGVLYEMVPPPRYIALAISSRIKVMANLDIAERRLPQDGRIALTVHGRAVDLRVSVLPTMFGESVVMRVLDRSGVSLDLNKLGMREGDLNIFRQLIRRPNGICVVTGPTGSGKTTTLYSALNELNDISTKIITCEDPVEYDIDGLIQVQINSEIEMTFAKALRAILRQDPDVVLVGECRDLETAQISVQAALTGHLVFTTLHTNDAPAAIARLLDMGVQPYLITAVLEGVLAQRLVRRICQHCKTEYQPTEENLMELDLRPEDIAGRSFFIGRGCDYCNNTGYKGRMAIHEIMMLDDDIRELIMQRASTNVIRNEARKRGMRNLRESGLLAIYDGLTTIEEVVKETVLED
jgi:type IV pilus assembly protein PilB